MPALPTPKPGEPIHLFDPWKPGPACEAEDGWSEDRFEDATCEDCQALVYTLLQAVKDDKYDVG